jgi:hypothetical protein
MSINPSQIKQIQPLWRNQQYLKGLTRNYFNNFFISTRNKKSALIATSMMMESQMMKMTTILMMIVMKTTTMIVMRMTRTVTMKMTKICRTMEMEMMKLIFKRLIWKTMTMKKILIVSLTSIRSKFKLNLLAQPRK